MHQLATNLPCIACVTACEHALSSCQSSFLISPIFIITETSSFLSPSIPPREKLHRLQFGTDKCEILKVGKKMVTLPKLELHGVEIEEKKVVKYVSDYLTPKVTSQTLLTNVLAQ